MERRKFIGVVGSAILPWVAGCTGGSTEQEATTTTIETQTTLTTETTSISSKTPTSIDTTSKATTTTTQTPTTTNTIAAPDSVPTYTVVQTRDVSYGGVIRVAVEVKTAKNVMSFSKKEYLQIAQDVVHRVTAEAEVNTVHIGFWKQNATVGQESNFAYVEWAPFGEWKQAEYVKAGNYSSHEYTINAPAFFELVKFDLPNSVELGSKVQPSVTVKNHGLTKGSFRGIIEMKQSYSWASLSVFEEEIPSKRTKTWKTEPIVFDFIPSKRDKEFRLRGSRMVQIKGEDSLTDSMQVKPRRLTLGGSFTTSSQEKITVENLRLKNRYSYESFDNETKTESAPDEKQFAFVDVIRKNVGDYNIYGPSAMSFKALSNDRVYETAFLTFKDKGKLKGKELQPGNKERGWIAFEIPDHLSRDDISILYESSYTGGKRIDGKVKVKWSTG